MLRRIAVGLVGLAPIAALAQDKQPARPQLYAGSDTNSAQSYYDFGLSQIKTKPEIAADAFYWATVLEPTSADAFYARRVALLLTDRRRLVRYWNGEKSLLRNAEVKRIDSLYLRALTLNPFLYELPLTVRVTIRLSLS